MRRTTRPILEKMKRSASRRASRSTRRSSIRRSRKRSTKACRRRSRRCRTAPADSRGADIRNGWRIDRALGRWGNDYGRRAVAAWNGIGVNAPEDAIFMSTDLGGGKKLDGANRYVLHFDPQQLPPTEGFWSLSLYDDKQRFVANPAQPPQHRQHGSLEDQRRRLARHRDLAGQSRAATPTGCPRRKGRSA